MPRQTIFKCQFKKCSAPIVQLAGRGRTRRYCSVTCRLLDHQRRQRIIKRAAKAAAKQAGKQAASLSEVNHHDDDR